MKYRIHIKNSNVIIKGKLSYNEQMNDRELNYLSQNRIDGLFRISSDGKKQLTYEAPCSVSLEKYLKNNRLQQNQFWRIMAQMMDIMIAVKSRGLYPEHLLVKRDTVFLAEDTMEMFFLYRPIVSTKGMSDNMFAVIHDIIYQEIKKGGGVKQSYLIDFQNYLLQGDYNPEHVRQYIGKASPLERQGSGVKDAGRQAVYAESGDSERMTVLLVSDNKGMPKAPAGDSKKSVWLTRIKGNEKTALSGDVLYIGRGSQNDYCIAGNASIGRRHAVLEKYEDGYYLQDMGSVNGTSVNGKGLTGEEKRRLKNGDRIRLGDEQFIFEDK